GGLRLFGVAGSDSEPRSAPARRLPARAPGGRRHRDTAKGAGARGWSGVRGLAGSGLWGRDLRMGASADCGARRSDRRADRRVAFGIGAVPARVVASSLASDVALLQLEKVPPGLVAARLGDSNRIEVGDAVFVVGHPFGLDYTLTTGVL